MPRLSRSHYRRELAAWTLLPIMIGAIEGGTVGVLAKNTFAGLVDATVLDFAVGILAGAPAFANITSFVWAGLSIGRDKVRLITGLQIATALLVAGVALAPKSELGLAVVTCAAVGARIAWTGVITLRSTVWQANYPRAARARMAGKLATVQSLMLAGVGVLIGAGMRWNDGAYHVIYPAVAAVGVAGAAVYGRMRVRGHRALRRAERVGERRAAFMSPAAIVRVLRGDRAFARYMLFMFITGLGNLMMTPLLVIIVRDKLDFGYLRGILLVETSAIVMIPLSVPFWARLLDRGHIVRFRVVHCWWFVASAAAVTVGALTLWKPLFWIGSVLRGIALGGGVLGWNLGHQDFARPEDSSRYMGVNVTLTGVRGIVAPVAGVAMYRWFDGMGHAWGVFALALVCTLVGSFGFLSLGRDPGVPAGRPVDRRMAA